VLKFMYTLSSCFLRHSEEVEMIQGTLYHNLQLKISQGFKRTLYFRHKGDLDEWCGRLEKATGVRSLFTHFTVGNIIGQGQFGKVYVGQSKPRGAIPYHKVLPGKKVAIKVVEKKNESRGQLES
jgi:serine/threonine protein kinase